MTKFYFALLRFAALSDFTFSSLVTKLRYMNEDKSIGLIEPVLFTEFFPKHCERNILNDSIFSFPNTCSIYVS